MAREGVALDEYRTIRRNRHVPGDKAHLRNDVHRLQAHRLDLLPVGDLRAGDALAGHRVEFKDLARLVRAHTADHARIQIDRRGHAAAIDVVHHLAVADADIGVDDAFLFVAQQRRDADGVDRGRAERGNRLMLDDLVLHNADARRLEARVERVNVSIILRRAFENPLPARTVDRLADDIAAPLHELGELFLRRGGEIEPFALDLLVEELVKLGLVVKEVPEFLVVHPRDDVVGNAARDLRGALRVV